MRGNKPFIQIPDKEKEFKNLLFNANNTILSK